MSPTTHHRTLGIDRVAIIGAGPCGLAGARYLAAENKFSKVEIFEQRPSPGGVWNHTPLNIIDDEFTIPRTRPTARLDTPIWTNDSAGVQFVSPVYDFLETNIPHTLMNYSDLKFPEDSSLFPRHEVVRKYLQDYAEELGQILSLQTQVKSVRKIQSGEKMCWQIQLVNLKTRQEKMAEFDAILVASGHYNDPFIPNIEGLAEFEKAHPGSVSHSKFYRRPDQYSGKKVIVVGNSASGIDLSLQISSVSQLPVIVSEKTKPNTPVEERSWAKMVPEIVGFAPETRGVHFSDGTTEFDVDAIVFCTGYFYSFPFLDMLSPPIVTDGSCAHHLYQHVIYSEDPTLAFLGIPQRIVPFPVSEAQAAWVARLWSERLPMPLRREMVEWEAKTIADSGAGKTLHNLAFPKDLEYINTLHDQSMSASKVPGLVNDGKGKIPPYWGAEKAWARERFPMIKIASRALGERRHEIRSLEDLGFDYKAWKAVHGNSD